MKNLVRISGFVFVASWLFAGCGEKAPKPGARDSGGQLTASDLALLMDYHAWTGAIPEAQQPIKSIRLVTVRRDGRVIAKLFDTGNNLGSAPCTSVLLGFKAERGTFTGYLNAREANGGGIGWNLNITNEFADGVAGWASPGTLVWTGNRAELAMIPSTNGMDTILDLELVK
jgi:hypothetical protein